MRKRIYYDDTDAGGIVYHANYLKYCEQARSEPFFKKGIFFEKDGFVVKEINAKYLKPAKLGDIIEIKTSLITLKKTSLILKQEIFKENEKLFEMQITLVFLKDSKISKIPQEYIKVINEYKNER
jgi:acyl-CoA thioester hydrolase